MFESAELGHKIDKETFKKEVPKLRAALLDAQYEMLEKKEFPVVILISGVDGSGKDGGGRNGCNWKSYIIWRSGKYFQWGKPAESAV